MPNQQESHEPERVALQGENSTLRRRRAIAGLVGVVLFAAAFGGIGGLIGGRIAGLVTAAVVGVPLLYITMFNARRRLWIQRHHLIVRTWGERSVDLVTAPRIDLLVTDVRGTRTVSLLVNAGQRHAAVKVDLAVYSGAGGRELGVLALRRLADAVVNNTEASGMVFSELLIAHLRSEARGDAAAERPLHRLASAAPSGKLARRFPMEVVSSFVAGLR